MSQRVKPGKIALNSRRKSALERSKTHLSDKHKDGLKDPDEHVKKHKSEIARLEELVGKA